MEMLKINRLRIEIETENGQYGVDESFDSGLNFLASEDNTCGKSSILEAIYYCLGFEEIIGGKGEKVLTERKKKKKNFANSYGSSYDNVNGTNDGWSS